MLISPSERLFLHFIFFLCRSLYPPPPPGLCPLSTPFSLWPPILLTASAYSILQRGKRLASLPHFPCTVPKAPEISLQVLEGRRGLPLQRSATPVSSSDLPTSSRARGPSTAATCKAWSLHTHTQSRGLRQPLAPTRASPRGLSST